MQVLPGNQLDRRADESDIMGRDVAAEIDPPLRKFQHTQVSETPRIGGGLRKTEQVNIRRPEEFAHDRWGSGLTHQKRRVNGSAPEGYGRLLRFEIQQCRRPPVLDPIRFEQRHGQRPGAAARR